MRCDEDPGRDARPAQVWLALFVAACLGAVACSDQTEASATSTDPDAIVEPSRDTREDDPCGDRSEITVPAGHVERLYQVVNNSAHAGYCVRLEAGLYALDPGVDPSGEGVLVLQPDMVLIGANTYRDVDSDGIWDPWDASEDPNQYPDPATETIIDGSEVTPTQFYTAACQEEGADPPDGLNRRRSPITFGAGNVLQNLTLRDFNRDFQGVASFDAAVAGAPLSTDDPIDARLTNCVVSGGHVGVSVTMMGCALADRSTLLTLEGNVMMDNRYAGLLLMNAYTDHARMEAEVTRNRFRSNLRGLQAIAGVAADSCVLELTSSDNLYEDNDEVGLALFGQADPPGAVRNGGHDNRLLFESIGDRIAGNGTAPTIAANGGISLTGSFLHYDRALGATGNQIQAHLDGTTFVRGREPENQFSGVGRVDVSAWGYRAPWLTSVYGDNTVALELSGCVSDGAPVVMDHSDPDDPSGSNRVTIVGGEEALRSDNEGISGIQEL